MSCLVIRLNDWMNESHEKRGRTKAKSITPVKKNVAVTAHYLNRLSPCNIKVHIVCSTFQCLFISNVCVWFFCGPFAHTLPLLPINNFNDVVNSWIKFNNSSVSQYTHTHTMRSVFCCCIFSCTRFCTIVLSIHISISNAVKFVQLLNNARGP